MNKNRTFITLLIAFCFIGFSCGDDYVEPAPVPLTGEWLTQKRVLESNNPEVNERVNSMFVADAKQFTIKRNIELNPNNYEQGAMTTSAENPASGIPSRRRESTFTLKGDSIFISDAEMGNMPSAYSIRSNTLTIKSKVGKQAIEAIIIEIGGDINWKIPDDIEGVLITTDRK